MRLTLETTDDPRRYAPLSGSRPRRVIIEVDGDDLSMAGMLEDLVQPALLAAGYPAELVQALTYEEAVTLHGPAEHEDRAYE